MDMPKYKNNILIMVTAIMCEASSHKFFGVTRGNIKTRTFTANKTITTNKITLTETAVSIRFKKPKRLT